MSQIPVAILPSHPAEGWMSMNRYWDALMRCIRDTEATDFSFQCPLELTEIWTPRAPVWERAFRKKVTYPRKVKSQVKNGVAHILDHSYAFLLADIPERVRSVVTVHDLLPLREPEDLSPKAISRYRSRIEWIKKADLVLSDSEATKNDLIDLIDLSPNSIEVLALGVDSKWNGESYFSRESLPAAPYLLSIGGNIKRKNLGILPTMLEKIRLTHPSVILARAGDPLSPDLLAEFTRRCGPGSVVEFGKVPDSTLAALYHHATAVVIPSTYEGFGLPVLEGMALGAPVVCSNTTSLPEVGGSDALYFDPAKPLEAAARVLEILEGNEAWLEELRHRARQRAERFTWPVHFSKLLEIYRDLAKGSRTIVIAPKTRA